MTETVCLQLRVEDTQRPIQNAAGHAGTNRCTSSGAPPLMCCMLLMGQPFSIQNTHSIHSACPMHVVFRWSKLNSQFTCLHNIFTNSVQCNIHFITKVCYSHLAGESSYTMCNSQPTIPSSDLSCKDNNFLRRTISE